jgi:2-amino-4-hydroxy-6-hydroxymethyldihydropteridine diphosphokinase
VIRPPVEPIVIGLGGNLGSDAAIRERFDRARAALTVIGPVRSARLYRTAPIGPEQPAYLNIEQLLGRRRAIEARWGPRPIDLDVLVWGQRAIRTAELEVPHPRLAERRFALLPLIDLVGDGFVIPGFGAAGELAGRVADQDCEEIAATW